MSDQTFHHEVDTILLEIEDAFCNDSPVEESQITGGVLTIELESGAKIIISRQTPLKEIWVAHKSGAYHFRFNGHEKNWQTSDGQELFNVISQIINAEIERE